MPAWLPAGLPAGLPAWWSPTARTIGWTPLALVAGCLGVLTALPSYGGALPSSLTGIAAGAVAAAVVAGTHDPAAALLSAMPTSAPVRLARRLAMLVPAGLLAWVATVGGALSGLLLLMAVGVAVSARGGAARGAAVPLAWTALAWAAGFDWDLR